MVYGDFKDLNSRATADNVLSDKVFNIAKNPKYEGYQHGHASMVCKFFLIKNLLVDQLKMKLFLIKYYQKNYISY